MNIYALGIFLIGLLCVGGFTLSGYLWLHHRDISPLLLIGAGFLVCAVFAIINLVQMEGQ